MKNKAHENPEAQNSQEFSEKQSSNSRANVSGGAAPLKNVIQSKEVEFTTKEPLDLVSRANSVEQFNNQIKKGFQLQRDNLENLLAERDGLKKQLSKLENNRIQFEELIKDKDSRMIGLSNQNKHLQGELSRQNTYIQHINGVNSELARLLTEAINELESFRDARATRILRALRSFSPKKLFAAFSQVSIDGNLDLPESCEITSGDLSVSGWAFARGGAEIVKVEAFLGEFRLGEVFYGKARPDVLSVHSLQTTADCGFQGTLSFDPLQVGTGARTLKIVVADSKGNCKEFTRLIIVELAKNLPVTVNVTAAFNRICPSPITAEAQNAAYSSWIVKNEPKGSDLSAQRKTSDKWSYRPLISVVTPVYNTPADLLEAAIQSVLKQTYENWELCLVDGASDKTEVKSILANYAGRDPRIRVKFLDSNLGIAGNSNEAINMARGEFIALLDHDDELAPNALYENAFLLNRHPDADMIYSDEDKLEAGGNRCEPYFKPDWSPDFFCSSMYTCHLGVYRKSLVDKIGGFRAGFDGAQDYDLVLRLTEQTDKIHHVSKILYHWRKAEGSTALSLNTKDYAKSAQIKAVSEHFMRLNVEAEVTPGLADNLLRVKRKLPAHPKISIIIPTRDQVNLLQNCLNSIQTRSSYSNYEIIIVDNNSSERETTKYFEEVAREPAVRVLEYHQPFNFAAINNFAVKQAKGELLLFLNNDTEVVARDWLEAMVEHAVRPEVGAVGARLLYPNGMVQHAGVIIGVGGVAGHSHKFYPGDHPGYFSRAKAIQNLSAVTAACMMVRADVFKSAGGFNEKDLAVAFNDVDLCLRIRQKGFLIIYTPYAELYHYESISRGADHTPQKAIRFQREVEYMLENWKDVLLHDPYYSPNLTLEKEDFSIANAAKFNRK